MSERHLIGFSLSFCLRDIAEGRVNVDEVLFIQTSCSPETPADVEDILTQYGDTYWRRNVVKAKEAFDVLYNDPDLCRIGWATSRYSTMNRGIVPIGWGHWLSTDHAWKPPSTPIEFLKLPIKNNIPDDRLFSEDDPRMEDR